MGNTFLCDARCLAELTKQTTIEMLMDRLWMHVYTYVPIDGEKMEQNCFYWPEIVLNSIEFFCVCNCFCVWEGEKNIIARTTKICVKRRRSVTIFIGDFIYFDIDFVVVGIYIYLNLIVIPRVIISYLYTSYVHAHTSSITAKGTSLLLETNMK